MIISAINRRDNFEILNPLEDILDENTYVRNLHVKQLFPSSQSASARFLERGNYIGLPDIAESPSAFFSSEIISIASD